MHKLMRFYNQNRKQIWITIGIILAIIFILQLLNSEAEKDGIKQQTQSSTSSDSTPINTTRYDTVDLGTEKSVLSGNKISSEQQEQIDIIDEFFKYCNEGNLKEAYNLLTEECKQEMYATEQYFQEGYYKQILNAEKKNITVENWNDNIYKVKISEDFLSSGKYSTENTIQDYITVKEEDNGEYKLNVNNYIEKTYLDKEISRKDINIKVIEKNTYMDYTTYVFEITNNSVRPILMDDLENFNNMYIQDGNEIQYSSYTHELSKAELQVNPDEKKKVEIKYYSKYSSTKDIQKIVFFRTILDYDKYLNLQDKSYYDNYYTFEIGV